MTSEAVLAEAVVEAAFEAHPWHTTFLAFIYWLLAVLGTIRGYIYLRTAVFRARIGTATAYHLSTMVVLFTCAGTVAMNSISAVEIRYNVFPIAVLSVLGVYWILERRAGFDRRSIMTVALALTLALGGAVGSYYIGALASTSLGAGVANFDMKGHRCYPWGKPPA